MTTHTLTLNRAHKVVERLKTLAKQHETLVLQNGSATDIALPVGNGVIARLGERCTEFESAMRDYQSTSESLVFVRQAIGRANSANGINDLLAEQEGINRTLKILKTVISQSGDSSAVSPSELKDYPVPQVQQSGGGYLSQRQTGIKVLSLSLDRKKDLEDEAKALQSKLHGLADRISEANRASVTFELSAEISEAVGL